MAVSTIFRVLAGVLHVPLPVVYICFTWQL